MIYKELLNNLNNYDFHTEELLNFITNKLGYNQNEYTEDTYKRLDNKQKIIFSNETQNKLKVTLEIKNESIKTKFKIDKSVIYFEYRPQTNTFLLKSTTNGETLIIDTANKESIIYKFKGKKTKVTTSSKMLKEYNRKLISLTKFNTKKSNHPLTKNKELITYFINDLNLKKQLKNKYYKDNIVVFKKTKGEIHDK